MLTAVRRLLAVLTGLVGLVCCDVIIYDKSYTIIDEFNDLPAHFGPLFPLEGLRAFALMASDMYGCDGMDRPPKRSDERFVVLIARNNCTFYEKVLNAERAGYDAAIVYNVDSDDLIEMSGDSNASEETHIPAMFIGYFSALEIRNNYLYDPAMKDFMLVLNRDLPYDINKNLLIICVVVVVIVFLGVIGMFVARCIHHRTRVRRDRLPRRDLKKLPVIKYNAILCRYDSCSICLDEYTEGERVRVLPCEHLYHTKCIDPWLTEGKRTCPLCKCKIRRSAVRGRRRTSTSSSSSDDTRPLLNSTRPINTNGTFAQQAGANPVPVAGSSRSNDTRPLTNSTQPFAQQAGANLVPVAGSSRSNPFDRDQPSQQHAATAPTGPSITTRLKTLLRRPFRRASSIDSDRTNILPAVSAAVNISPPSAFQNVEPEFQGLVESSSADEYYGTPPNTVEQLRVTDLRSRGEALIGVAALPNVNFIPPNTRQGPRASSRAESPRTSRRNRNDNIV